MFYCQPLFLANLGHDFASTPFVANNEPHPSKDTAECQAAERQEAEPITAQRKRELEHYLKLKRCLNVVGLSLSNVVHFHYFYHICM